MLTLPNLLLSFLGFCLLGLILCGLHRLCCMAWPVKCRVTAINADSYLVQLEFLDGDEKGKNQWVPVDQSPEKFSVGSLVNFYRLKQKIRRLKIKRSKKKT